MKTVLPFKMPIFTNYTDYAGALSAVCAHTDEYLPWVYSCFVQMEIPNDYSLGFKLDYTLPIPYYSLPWLDLNVNQRPVIRKAWPSIKDYLIDMIDQKIYVHFLIDTYFIPLYTNYQEYHLSHGIFIYGYDTDTQEFYVADNFSTTKGKYAFKTCTFKELEEAYYGFDAMGERDYLYGVIGFSIKQYYHYGFWEFRDEYKYSFNTLLFTDLLADYLQSRDSSKRLFQPRTLYGKPFLFGLSCYEYLAGYVKHCGQNGLAMDVKGAKFLVEHKTILSKTCGYLLQNGLVSRNLESAYEELTRNSTLLLMLMLKWNLTRRSELIETMRSTVSALRKEDGKAGEALLWEIQKSQGQQPMHPV